MSFRVAYRYAGLTKLRRDHDREYASQHMVYRFAQRFAAQGKPVASISTVIESFCRVRKALEVAVEWRSLVLECSDPTLEAPFDSSITSSHLLLSRGCNATMR